MPAKSNYSSRSGDIDYSRLCRAMEAASLSLREFRNQRTELIRDYAGENYGENAARRRMLLNLNALFVSVMSKTLVANQPRYLVTTTNQAAKPVVSAMGQWSNKQVEKIDLKTTLQRSTIDALFCLGCVKVALSDPGMSAKSGWMVPAGEAFAEVVSFDDLLFDVHARDFREAGFIAHRFRMPLDVAREWKEFGKRRKDLKASEDPRYHHDGSERTSHISRALTGDNIEFEDMVDLWEVYLPRHGLICTVEHDMLGLSSGRDSTDYEPLRVQKWVGPEGGPFHFLSLGPPVPDNAISKAPLQDLNDLNNLINNAWRKVDRQVRRMKVVSAVKATADSDGDRIINANDGDGVRVDDPEAVREIVFGGVNPVLFNFVLQARQVWNVQAGNVDLAAGSAPQSKTATQDKLLNENAGAMMQGYQDSVSAHASSVGKALCWFWHHDPYRKMRVEYTHPGLPAAMSITRQVDPQQRVQIPWNDIDARVDPYSLPFASPAQQLAAMNGVLTQVIPILPLLQQQGVEFDAQFWLKKTAEYLAQPDLPQMFRLVEPAQVQDTDGGDEMGTKSPTTTRTYNRYGSGQDRPQKPQSPMAAAGAMNSPEFSQNGQGY